MDDLRGRAGRGWVNRLVQKYRDFTKEEYEAEKERLTRLRDFQKLDNNASAPRQYQWRLELLDIVWREK